MTTRSNLLVLASLTVFLAIEASTSGVDRPTAAPEKIKKPVFQEKGFWDGLYKQTNSSENDWFQQWRDPMIARRGGQNIADVVLPFLDNLGAKCSLRVLHIGCGTSNMPHQMLQDGFMWQVCIDSSEVAMSALREKFASLDGHSNTRESTACGHVPSMNFLTQDATNTDFGSSSFDIIMDKGTLDAQVGGPNSTLEVAATLDEAVRLLRIGGLYIQISHSDNRGPLLQNLLSGTPRAWKSELVRTIDPLLVPAPIAYVKQNGNASSSPRPRKNASYVYIYSKAAIFKDEL